MSHDVRPRSIIGTTDAIVDFVPTSLLIKNIFPAFVVFFDPPYVTYILHTGSINRHKLPISAAVSTKNNKKTNLTWKVVCYLI